MVKEILKYAGGPPDLAAAWQPASIIFAALGYCKSFHIIHHMLQHDIEGF
jgi:hypothetical protein